MGYLYGSEYEANNPTPFRRGVRVFPTWRDSASDGMMVADYLCLGVVYTTAGAVKVVIENMESGTISVVDPRVLRLTP